MVKELIICRGIPGSGKTTYAKEWAKCDSSNRIRLNLDDLRNMLGEYWVTKREPVVKAMLMAGLNEAAYCENPYHIIIDATNFERNLYLTTQVIEMNVPVIVALNMIDIVEKNGNSINEKLLEKTLGVPVVGISALKEENLDTLMKKALDASNKTRKGLSVIKDEKISSLIKKIEAEYQNKNVQNSLFHATKLIENDEIEVKNNENLVSIIDEYKKDNYSNSEDTDFEATIADLRYQFITNECNKAVKAEKNGKEKISFSDRVDKILTNKWIGIPIFLVILFLIFHLTFSTNLFFIGSFGLFENEKGIKIEQKNEGQNNTQIGIQNNNYYGGRKDAR